MSGEGVLFLIVGPSGVGKDTLIESARETLAQDSQFVFARRVITRPAEAGGEAHEAISEADFHRAEETGAFMASWRAHGLAYGIRALQIGGVGESNGAGVVATHCRQRGHVFPFGRRLRRM